VSHAYRELEVMKSMLKSGIVLLLLASACLVKGNTGNQPSLPEAEAALKTLFAEISARNPDERNLAIADSITDLFETTLLLPGSFEYPFDQLNTIGKITTANQQIRIFTWNLPLKNVFNQYYGFLLYKTSDRKGQRVYQLTDRSATLDDPAMATCKANNWYGCLIYDIVETKVSGEIWYTLLGYDPDNMFTSKKLVDVLWFDQSDEPVFGKPVFHYKNQMQYRILFEYSAKVQMSLKWNDKMNMIVFDHLSPSKPSYTGNAGYYGPDLSYDGLRFEKGVWELVEDIDMRN
jgi:hypothetical protein